MPPTNHLAAQLTAYSLTHTTDAATTWAAVLRHLDPEGLRAIAATMPADSMGTSLRAQLEALAHAIQTQPFTLGDK